MTEKQFFPLMPETAEPSRGQITTAALRFCDICDIQIAGIGGPGYGSICLECGTLIRRGQVKMDRQSVVAAYSEQENGND